MCQRASMKKKTYVSPKDCALGVLQHQPKANAILYFSDAVWQASSSARGLGWLCTDQGGATIFEGETALELVGSALIEEALAHKTTIEAAISHGIQDLICYSDSKHMIAQIGNTSVIALQGILHDVDVLSRSLTSISFKFAPRLCNVAAERLAKRALGSFLNSRSRVVNSV